MNWQERISINPNICYGKPCIRRTRIMVSIILDYLGSGESVDTIMLEYPGLKKWGCKYGPVLCGLIETGLLNN